MELFDMFSDYQAAMEWPEVMVWADGHVCPDCESDRTCEAKHPYMEGALSAPRVWRLPARIYCRSKP